MRLAPAQGFGPTCRGALRAAAHRLARAGVETPQLDARLLLMEATALSLESLLSAPDRPLTREEHEHFAHMLARRAAREPLAYVLGRRAFWSLELGVAPGVLVPRPETETLVEAVLKAACGRDAPYRILDLGTGSGCVLLSLLSELPNAFGIGVDRSADALSLARANAAALGLGARAALLCADWLSAIAASFDIVVSNPPYVSRLALAGLAPEIRLFEPPLALDGGADGLNAYRTIIGALTPIVAQDGLVALELGDGQARAVEKLLEAAGFRDFVYRTDLAGKARVVVARPRAFAHGNEKSCWKSSGDELG
jgi:release factor glutamine methyltransferase